MPSYQQKKKKNLRKRKEQKIELTSNKSPENGAYLFIYIKTADRFQLLQLFFRFLSLYFQFLIR